MRYPVVQPSPKSPQVIRFGLFEADLSAASLRKRGRKVPIQDQPFRVLTLLLVHSGELVTREDFHRALWPDDTFVDFDEGLNKAIQKLRQALDDSSDNPRFIETLPRRGYRFIFPVERNAEQASASRPQHTPMDDNAVLSAVVYRPVKARRTKVLGWLLFGVVSVALVVAGVYILVLHPKAQESPRTVPLTSFPGRQITPAFSRDGKQVAFAWDGDHNFNIYVTLVTGAEPLRLTNNPADEFWPTWSPDGSRIAFCRQLPNQVEIWAIPALGGAERKLGESQKCEGLSWSPDGKFLAIVDRSAPQGPWLIFLLSVDSGEKQQLTSAPREYTGDSEPKFSPDGSTVAFGRSAAILNSDVYVLAVTATGKPIGEARRLTFDKGPLSDLDWTADGRRIVYSWGQIGRSSLWIVQASGGKPQRFGVAGENPSTLSASRAGNQLVYEHNVQDANIWQVSGPSDTGKPMVPTKLIGSTQLDLEPQFSPDGTKIAFTSDRSGRNEIWVCDRFGRNTTPITSGGGPEPGSPRWSPDSHWIVFDSAGPNNSDIYAISAVGGLRRRLTSGPSNKVRPSWSRDGRWIYFGSNRSGAMQIWKVLAQGGTAVQVTRMMGGSEAFESADGKFVFYAKLDAPGIWKVPSEGGEETQLLDQGGHSLWAVAVQGICFFDVRNPAGIALKLYSFPEGKTTLINQFSKDTIVDPNSTALSVSPDGRRALYTQIDQDTSDLMLMENLQ